MKIINNINDRSRVHAERWPLRMLQEWRKTKHRTPHGQMVELVQALDKIHRNDLVAVVRQNMEESETEGESLLSFFLFIFLSFTKFYD